eukprot:227987_1
MADFFYYNLTDFNDTDWDFNGSGISSTMETDSSRFASCNECTEVLGDDCWCWEAMEGDYYQVFTIALMVWLMYLASYCLAYARTAAAIGGLSEMNISEMKQKSAWTDIQEMSGKYMESGYVSGMPAVLYIILNAVLSSAYFAVKLIMYLEDDPHHLGTINQDFQNQPFSDFYTARIILLVTVYIHSFMSIKQNLQIYKESKEYSSNP